MSSAIFVHRAFSCDLLLYSDTPYKHAVSIFKKLSANINAPKHIEEDPGDENNCTDGFVVAWTSGLSISIHGEDFVPLGYNPRGTATIDRITNLDENGEPRGFIPYESEIPIDLTKKDLTVLDTELEEYFEEGNRASVNKLSEQAFKHFCTTFKMDQWTNVYNDSLNCGSTKEEMEHWSRVIYDQEHEMDWEPTESF